MNNCTFPVDMAVGCALSRKGFMGCRKQKNSHWGRKDKRGIVLLLGKKSTTYGRGLFFIEPGVDVVQIQTAIGLQGKKI